MASTIHEDVVCWLRALLARHREALGVFDRTPRRVVVAVLLCTRRAASAVTVMMIVVS